MLANENLSSLRSSSGMRGVLLVALGLATSLFFANDYAYADSHEHWATKALRERDYKLSPDERDGVYHCGVKEEIVLDVQFENGFALVIFARGAPVAFVEREIPTKLLSKLRNVELGNSHKLLCVHSAFRDDWQKQYDRDGTVYPRLLNIETVKDTTIVKAGKPKDEP